MPGQALELAYRSARRFVKNARLPSPRSRSQSPPVALTIAGSDSGGGAGAQADLKTFAALGLHGVSALTCVTAQNPRAVSAIQACRPEIVRAQIDAVFAELPPRAMKTGMLYSAAIIAAVAQALRDRPRLPLVVDPVMVATSGRRLLPRRAVETLERELFPLAALLTPNLMEAEVLLKRRLTSLADSRSAARELAGAYGCPALVKGGHLAGSDAGVDIYYDGECELALKAPYVRGLVTHGTGCTLSAAIAAYLALGHELADAVRRGKRFLSRAIAGRWTVHGHTVLSYFSPLH